MRSFPAPAVPPFFHVMVRTAPGRPGVGRSPGARFGHLVGVLGLEDPVPTMLGVDYPGDHVVLVVDLVGGVVVRPDRYPVLIDPADGVLDGDPGAVDLGVGVEILLG